jgi:hypothetical protein
MAVFMVKQPAAGDRASLHTTSVLCVTSPGVHKRIQHVSTIIYQPLQRFWKPQFQPKE